MEKLEFLLFTQLLSQNWFGHFSRFGRLLLRWGVCGGGLFLFIVLLFLVGLAALPLPDEHVPEHVVVLVLHERSPAAVSEYPERLRAIAVPAALGDISESEAVGTDGARHSNSAAGSAATGITEQRGPPPRTLPATGAAADGLKRRGGAR